jgi:hypothetical protein
LYRNPDRARNRDRLLITAEIAEDAERERFLLSVLRVLCGFSVLGGKMTDEEFLQAFEDCTLKEFHHADHIRVAHVMKSTLFLISLSPIACRFPARKFFVLNSVTACRVFVCNDSNVGQQ